MGKYTCGVNNEEFRWRKSGDSVSHCMFMLEDLHRLARRPELVANKFWPGIDYGAVDCWLMDLYNRTHGLGGSSVAKEVDEGRYTNLPHVRFNLLSESEKESVRLGRMDFDCSQTPM
jgi:hypothetical protein